MDQKDPTFLEQRGETGQASVSLTVENIGGIDESTVEFDPGVNVLVGRNATNRTSHLQALMAALGSDDVSLKSGADRATVDLSIDGEGYTREFVSEDGTVRSAGDPLLDDPELADLFAFLLESNEARRAVALKQDLREIVMRPVDTDAIDREIDEMRSRRDEIDDRLERLDDRRNRLPKLQEEYEQYQAELESQREKRDSLKAEIEAADADLEESKREQAELEEQLADLQGCRSDLEDVRYRIETEEDSIESLETEKDELEAELESLSTSVREINELGAEIDRLRERKEQLDSTIDKVRNVIQFNEEMLDDEDTGLNEFLEESSTRDSEQLPTDGLLPEDHQQVVCWTCGSEVERDEISSMLSDLEGISTEIIEMRRTVKADLEECWQQKKEIESAQNRRNQAENKLERLEQEITNRQETIAELQTEREELIEEIETLEDDIERTRESDYDEILDLHKQANEVEFEIEQLQTSCQETEDEIESIEAELASYEDIETEREEVSERLTELRTKIDRMEQLAVESFNDHMDDILQLLDYDNIERVWIERTKPDGSRSGRSTTESTFTLHITRSTDSGTVFGDTIDNLSESEREVVGLVFALSGYLLHDVYEDVPFMLLDSLEAIDAERIAALIKYFEEYAGNIVVALLPEDARELSGDYNKITEL